MKKTLKNCLTAIGLGVVAGLIVVAVKKVIDTKDSDLDDDCKSDEEDDYEDDMDYYDEMMD